MIAAVRAARGKHGVPEWASLWDVEAEFPALPAKVVRAKLGALVRRKILGGCACGCRGDFEVAGDL